MAEAVRHQRSRSSFAPGASGAVDSPFEYWLLAAVLIRLASLMIWHDCWHAGAEPIGSSDDTRMHAIRRDRRCGHSLPLKQRPDHTP